MTDSWFVCLLYIVEPAALVDVVDHQEMGIVSLER